MSAGIDYLRNLTHLEQDLPTWRTCPEKCADYGHPGVTYNPWQDRTWCLCGQVIRDGNQFDTRHMACCDGPLTERITS